MPTTYYDVQLAQRARQEIDNIVAYLAFESPSIVPKFILAFKEQVARLHRLPARFPKIRERLHSHRIYRHVLFLRYRLVFRVEAHKVIILRAMHQSQLLTEVE